MSTPRVLLFQRLPEIYRVRDAEQVPPDQLKAYLAVVEEAFSAVHENVESLYHDLFIRFPCTSTGRRSCGRYSTDRRLGKYRVHQRHL